MDYAFLKQATMPKIMEEGAGWISRGRKVMVVLFCEVTAVSCRKNLFS